MPDLLAIQRQSYCRFSARWTSCPRNGKDTGLQSAFKDVFPISDFKETTALDFISYFDRQLGMQVRPAEGGG